MKKKEGSSSVGYMFLFMIVIILTIVTMYVAQAAKLMTHQHDIDDALTDSVLASLVVDDAYFFTTQVSTGTPVLRFRNNDEAYRNYKDCMAAAVSSTDFYNNLTYVQFIEYEVSGNTVKIITYSGNGGVKSTSSGSLGSVRTPGGTVVRKTSAYAKVRFDIRSILDGSSITKFRDQYCELEVNN